MYLRSHAQKYIPGVYLHICKLYTRVNLAHANWTLDLQIIAKHRGTLGKWDDFKHIASMTIFHDSYWSKFKIYSLYIYIYIMEK